MFEKEAEEYYESKPVHTYVDSLGFFHDLEGIKQAYIQGRIDERKANEWHYVKDGDLPKDENDVLIYSGEEWRMCVGRYSPKHKAWEAGCDTIAWKEIVLPELKE